MSDSIWSRLNWHAVFLGVWALTTLPALAMIVRLSVDYPTLEGIPYIQSIISAFRGPGMLIILTFYFATNVAAWSRAKLDYARLLHIDSTPVDKSLRIYHWGACFLCFWAWSLYLCLAGLREGIILIDIPYWVYPLVFFSCGSVALLLPFPFCGKDGRSWMLRSFGRICAVLCIPVICFRDFFVADQMNSLVVLFYDIEYSICYFVSDLWLGTDRCLDLNTYIRPVIACLPAGARFIHCIRRWRETGNKFPHLVNAGKYSCAFFIVIFGALAAHVPREESLFHYMWAGTAVIGSCYNWIWDVRMDWGLGNVKARHVFLRNELYYSWTWAYYCAIFVDFLLRLAWALSLTPVAAILNSEMLLLVTALLELSRRFMWNFFRVEWEQICVLDTLPTAGLLADTQAGSINADKTFSVNLNASDNKGGPRHCSGDSGDEDPETIPILATGRSTRIRNGARGSKDSSV